MFPVNLSVLPANRNNLLLWCTGWNLADMIFFYKFFGIISMILAPVHSVGCWIYVVKITSYSIYYKKDKFIACVYALIVGSALVILTNRKFIRNHAYEIFVVIHVTLAFVFVNG